MREITTNLGIYKEFESQHAFSFINKVKFQGGISREGIFQYVNYGLNNKISGWKIHVSPLLSNFEVTLKVVNTICDKKKTSFKFIWSLEGYAVMTGKVVSPSQFGKIITIYPNNIDDFECILVELTDALKKFDGLKVPSDNSFRNSTIVHYRYGAINPIIEVDDDNTVRSYIVDNLGIKVEDVRRPYFFVPKNIMIPQFISGDTHNDLKNTSLVFIGDTYGKEIEVHKILRRLASGNIYLGKNKNTKVIIKMAKYGALSSREYPEGTQQLLKKNEKSNLLNTELSSILNLPDFIDDFYIGKDYFLAEKFVNGISLRDYSAKLGITKPKKIVTTLDLQKVRMIFCNLKKLIKELHSRGYVFGDVSPDNFIVDDELNIHAIDIESVHKIGMGEPYLNLKTELFAPVSEEKFSELEADNYKLGMSMFWILTQKNQEVDKDPKLIKYYLNLIVNQYPSLKNMVNMILDLLSIDKTVADLEQDKIIQPAKDAIITSIIKKIECGTIADISTTNYIKSNLSLSYGIPGTLLYLNSIKKLNKEDRKRCRIWILEQYHKKLISQGLFFGKIGLACVLANLDCSYEENMPLVDLLIEYHREGLNKDLSLANGISGIILGLEYLSRIKNYPNFSNIIEDLLLSIEENIDMVPESNLEYGDIGIGLTLEYLVSNGYMVRETLLDKVRNKIYNIYNESFVDGIFIGLNTDGVVYPSLMTGGAGLVLYAMCTSDSRFLKNNFLDLYDVPFMANSGVNNGVAGFILPLIIGMKNRRISLTNRKRVRHILKYWQSYILTNFRSTKSELGWKADQGIDIKQDLGAGNLGIIFILDLLTEVLKDEEREDY
ncbi:hypothetical protein FC52_GL001073 [Lactobacillus pasteurii DSM 23907 = CRBIP 24.76]|nr:hypothetical protein [Lactobacillus pasteurii]KRK07187.1 hypothetical protein FC52_GL001073 [Lactobacillus pasteurii DSM 23907 = CRBIP 24.76]TDG77993.1 hypothetical protein C5L33_001798 [Lactobacillus pasteurii]